MKLIRLHLSHIWHPQSHRIINTDPSFCYRGFLVPPEDHLTAGFLKKLWVHEKALLENKYTYPIKPPDFDELAVCRIYDQVVAQPNMAQYFPDSFPKGRQCDRTYMWTVWNTIHPSRLLQH